MTETSEKVRECPVDSELGTHVAGFLAAGVSIKPCQRVLSLSLQELTLMMVGTDSYDVTTAKLNRCLHREEGASQIKATTLQYRVSVQGSRLEKAYEQKSADVFSSHGIDASTGIIPKGLFPEGAISYTIPGLDIYEHNKSEIDSYNQKKVEAEQIKAKNIQRTESKEEDCCYVFIDDVGVKRQKETRSTTKGETSTNAYVENTVIYIDYKSQHYTITRVGMANAFKSLLAFLIENSLLRAKRLVFITDGARIIKDNINKFFSFRQFDIILDWHHLEKRCNEILSMAIDRKQDEEHAIFHAVTRMLWVGNVEDAIAYLENLPETSVKSKKRLQEAKDYLTRKSPYIACYAFRKLIGLRNSSNRVEKENDLIVAKRQKNNGMSWSRKGSCALAILAAIKSNNELDTWLRIGTIAFHFVA